MRETMPACPLIRFLPEGVCLLSVDFRVSISISISLALKTQIHPIIHSSHPIIHRHHHQSIHYYVGEEKHTSPAFPLPTCFFHDHPSSIHPSLPYYKKSPADRYGAISINRSTFEIEKNAASTLASTRHIIENYQIF